MKNETFDKCFIQWPRYRAFFQVNNKQIRSSFQLDSCYSTRIKSYNRRAERTRVIEGDNLHLRATTQMKTFKSSLRAIINSPFTVQAGQMTFGYLSHCKFNHCHDKKLAKATTVALLSECQEFQMRPRIFQEKEVKNLRKLQKWHDKSVKSIDRPATRIYMRAYVCYMNTFHPKYPGNQPELSSL
ncbi:uncharacterized protein [Prorops nasuta]|uniref:uncharacterized protein n=1 Tax=Prorops nasuta TaxID=863751 RepID=UPI0034CFC145